MPQLDLQTAATAAFSLAFAYGVTKIAKSGSRDPQLPPGPPTLPIIGNLAILPLKDSYLKFTEWARIYGGVISLKVGSETIIVVSDLNAVNEILEKNGAITGSRPKFEPFRRFSGPGKFLLFAPYGALWRKLRKAAADLMKPVTRRNLNPIMMAEVSQLLYETHKDPEVCVAPVIMVS
ncbi:hypothetical protein FRC03_002722 [Tulasnella sp. 419]|nr:hypothetical protein FRC03_002722 [Tulasnella sp. 419]